MSKTVEFWFDYGSPTAYVGHWRLKEVARRTGAAIDLRPMLLGAVFQATDNHTPVQIVPKGKWMFWDLENYAERHGIPFVMNPYFIINTLPLMRGALVAERRGELERYTDVMFNAVWRDGFDMGRIDPACLLTAAEPMAEAEIDGLFISCTALNVSPVLSRLEELVGRPVITSNQAMAWHALRLAGIEDELANVGRYLSVLTLSPEPANAE